MVARQQQKSERDLRDEERLGNRQEVRRDQARAAPPPVEKPTPERAGRTGHEHQDGDDPVRG